MRMSNVMPRKFYLPREVRDLEPVRPEGTDLEIWAYEAVGHPYAIAFGGRAQKPLWHYRFRSVEARDARVRETIDSRRELLARREETKRAAREYRHDYKVGDVLVSSWGYDQTNVDYYEVVRVVSPTMIEIQAINGTCVREERGADYVVPVPGLVHGDVMRRRVREGGSVNTEEDYRTANRWTGRPHYQTASGWGH